MSTVFCNTVRASCMSSRTGFKWEISTSLTTVRDTFPFPSLVQHRTVFPTQPVGTSPCNTVWASNRHRSLSTVRDTFLGPYTRAPYGISNPPVGTPVQYRTGFQQASHFHISIYPVRLFTNHRTGLLVHIPYGILLPTTVSHIPENRTGLFFPPYGTIPFGRARAFPTTLLRSTDRDCNKHRTVFTFPAFPSFSWKFLGRISTRNRHDLRVRDTGHSLLFVGLPRTGSFPTSTDTHRTVIQPNFPQPYGIFVPVFFIPYGLKKP